MDITPKKSVGDLDFGMTREEVIEFLGSDFTTFKRFPDSPDTMAFDNKNLSVEFGKGDKLVWVSAFRPLQVFLHGVQLLDRRIIDLVNDLAQAGSAFEITDAGLENEELGIVIVEVDGRSDGVEIASTDG